jgi:signal transduction histidine kinase
MKTSDNQNENAGFCFSKEKLKELSGVINKVKKGDFSLQMGLSGDKDADFIISNINFLIFYLGKVQKLREAEISKIQEKNKELERTRRALTNILEDAEEAREKSEEEKNKTLSIITNLSDGLMVFSQDKRVSMVNTQAENFFSMKESEIYGKKFTELSQFPPFVPLVSLLGENIKGVFRKEISLRENLILEVDAMPVVSGENIEYVIILHDVTREKMVERIKTEFVSISAHQLRTPLAAIKWTLRMILDGDVGEITEEQRDYLEKTYLSNERMIDLINDLLDVTRIEEGRYLYKLVSTDIELVVQLVANSYKEEIDRKGIKMDLHKPLKKMPKMMLDVEKIKLAIQNLVENAIKYTLNGGSITINLKADKKEFEFSIEDTGVGIPEDQKDRIFTKFFRGSNVIKVATEGSGLGLFISKNIIEAHGGRIWFDSKEGIGTTFYFTLPIKEEFSEFMNEF